MTAASLPSCAGVISRLRSAVEPRDHKLQVCDQLLRGALAQDDVDPVGGGPPLGGRRGEWLVVLQQQLIIRSV